MGNLKENLDSVFSNVEDIIKNAKNSNFEEVVAKTKDYAEKAGKMSADRLDISKKKVELLDSKTKLSKAYEKLGKITYKQKEGENISNEDMESAFDEVTLLSTRISFLEEEINDLKADFNHRYGDILKKNIVENDVENNDDVIEFSNEDITIE